MPYQSTSVQQLSHLQAEGMSQEELELLTHLAQWLNEQMSQEQLEHLAREILTSQFTQYQHNPVGFIREVLLEYLWDKLVEVAEAVRDHPRVAVTGANSVGKGWLAARIVIWWLNAFMPAKVITTAAPPARQIKELLWSEIRYTQKEGLKRGVPLCGGEPSIMQIVTDNSYHWAKGFTIPTTGTEEERVSKFQGHHSPHLLAVVDEAHGVPEEIFDALDSCLSGGHNHLLLLSNPLAPSGPFYRRTRSPDWHVIQITAFDHPNVKAGREIIAGAVTKEKTYTRIRNGSRALREDEVLAKMSPQMWFEVPEFFSDYDEALPEGDPIGPIAGTTRVVVTPQLSTKVLGRFPLQSTNALINIAWVEAAKQRWLDHHEQFGDTLPEDAPLIPEVGLDVAEFGDDVNVLAKRYDFYVPPFKVWGDVDPLVTGDRAMEALGNKNLRVGVDGTGVGSGTGAHMRREGYKKARSVKVGARATARVADLTESKDEEMLPGKEFDRLRSQLLWAVREWLRTNERCMLPPNIELEEELAVLTYDKKPDEVLAVLPKKEVKKLLRRSPNRLDALMLTFAQTRVWRKIRFRNLSRG